MYNTALIIQYLSIALLLILSIYIFYKWKTRTQGLLLLNCIVTLINNAGYLCVMLAKDSNASLLGIQLSYLGRVWIPYTLILFSLDLCRIDIKKKLMGLLALIHTSVYFLVLFAKFIPLYYSSITFIEDGLFPHNKYGHGIAHYLYTFLLICYIVIGLNILIKATKYEEDKIRRWRLLWVTSAIAVECIFYILELTGVGGAYDTTVVGYAIASLMMAVAIFRYDLMDTLQLVRDYVLDELSQGIIAIGEDEIIEYYNKPALKILPELETQPEKVLPLIKKNADEGRSMEIGERIYTPMRKDLEEDGKKKGEIFVFIDDTEDIRHMEMLQKEKAKAEEANLSKSRFVSVVSHEIRTPMNAIVGMTDILLSSKDSLSEKQLQYLKTIETSGKALLDIVNDILDMSKLEKGKMEIIESEYDIRKTISDIVFLIENRVGGKDIKIVVDIDKSIPSLLIGDALRIRQILINLMNNSVKFTEKGSITLSIVKDDKTDDEYILTFSVSDTGQGIKEEDLKKLGEAFSQVDTKKNYGKEGTGLGISISKDFIALMGGRLMVESEYGKGTRFFFTISQKKVKEKREEKEDKTNVSFNGEKVLIVDDTEINLMVMEELLTPLNLSVTCTDCGEKALEIIDHESFSIIFMDYIMPGKNGIETTKDIRERGIETPIIALTGDTEEETRKEFILAGSNDILSKPVEYEKMKNLLNLYLN